jgi:hypothetical protein
MVSVGVWGQGDVCPQELEASLPVQPQSYGLGASVTATL